MSERGAPEPSELVYIPEPSWLPAIAALGLALVMAGVFVWLPYGVAGAIIAIVAIAGMIRSAGAGVERLPRRQRMATAVLPAVLPGKRKTGA